MYVDYHMKEPSCNKTKNESRRFLKNIYHYFLKTLLKQFCVNIIKMLNTFWRHFKDQLDFAFLILAEFPRLNILNHIYLFYFSFILHF